MVYDSAHVRVADLDGVKIPCVYISCDKMKRDSHLLSTPYNDVRCNEWFTRGNETRC